MGACAYVSQSRVSDKIEASFFFCDPYTGEGRAHIYNVLHRPSEKNIIFFVDA